ncbi:MAG: hypothetical protein K6G61_00615 [Solobacterium sp.]|nr:hypothetical protein [Solobacterium sp.]
MKKILLRILRTCIFIVLTICLLLSLQHTMISTTDVGITKYYYKTDRKTDIVLLGPSTVTFGLYPALLWDSFGYTSYNLGTGSQSLGISYYLLKEAVRQNSPDVVVLDCGRAFRDETVGNTAYLHYVTDNMPLFSRNRLDMINALSTGFTEQEKLALLVPMIGYHTRWDELEKADFEGNEKEMSWGARVSTAVKYEGQYDLFEVNTENALGASSVEYLGKIAELCRQNGAELMLITMPLLSRYKGIDQEEYEKRINAAYALESYASRNGLQYLNLIDKGEQIGLIPEKESKDGLHINYEGALKLTGYIGSYIHDHFAIKDHRNEKGYESFEKKYEEYLDYLPEGALRSANNLEVYLKWLGEIDPDRYLIVITEIRSQMLHPFIDYRESFEALGLQTDRTFSSYTVIDGGRVIAERSVPYPDTFPDEEVPFHYEDEDRGLKISLDPADQAVIINGTNYIEEQTGFHIVVYDKEQKDLADCIGIDTERNRYIVKHYNALNYSYKD